MAKRTSKKRADILLVEKGLAVSREKAQALIMAGLVSTPAGKILKPGSSIATDALMEVKSKPPYVGRGGIKLAHALECFGLDVSNVVALDVGASTGGFTDCLLQHGAQRIFAVDVGHGQLDLRLRQDARVVVLEGVNARYPFVLPSDDADPTVDLATIDVSFISCTKVIPEVARHVKEGGFIIVLVKPQFEAKRGEVGRGGVIKDVKVHVMVLARLVRWVVDSGFRLHNFTASPILGDAGNREFFLLLGK